MATIKNVKKLAEKATQNLAEYSDKKKVAHLEFIKNNKAKIHVGGKVKEKNGNRYYDGATHSYPDPGDEEGRNKIFDKHGITHVHHTSVGGEFISKRKKKK